MLATRTLQVSFMDNLTVLCSHRLPRQCMNVRFSVRKTTLLAGIRAKQINLHRLPKCLFQGTQWQLMEAGLSIARLLTVAGAAQVE